MLLNTSSQKARQVLKWTSKGCIVVNSNNRDKPRLAAIEIK